MNQELKFENDILVSTLNNPTTSAADLFAAGLDTSNTGLLSPDEYKQSPVIQLLFSDGGGNFNETQFNKAYELAANKYNELNGIKSWKDLEDDVVYNKRSIFAPLGAPTKSDQLEIEVIRNTERKTHGIQALSGWGESEYSQRELAQMNKIFDTKTQTWRDQTADELGMFGGLFSEPLVYATYDSDGEHFDEFLQRNVKHRKGEWKTDAEGNYYTETLGDREVYGKEVVAYSDILTRENSWLNKIDFFDSDGKTKSKFGTVVKTIANVAPYIIPGFNVYYGAFTATTALMEVLPTFYKATEGLVTGDDAKRSALFKAASKQEGFMRKFNKSHSDEARDSMWNFEQMGSLVGDVFGQLYQMRAAGSLAGIFKNSKKAEADIIKNIKTKNASKLAEYASQGKDAETALAAMVKNSPEMKALQKQTSDLASAFAIGYMALTSSADVYEDALAGGYGRRAAAMAALASTVGQYGIMRYNPISNRLGTWMLDETTGFTKNVNKKALKEALRPLYELFLNGTDVLAQASVKEARKGFASLLSSAGKTLRKTKNLFNEGDSLLASMLIESTEEVTEEAVQDMTKGVFDLLSSVGFGGMTGSFGGWNNVFSKQGFERYLTSLIGGAVGGGLFHVNQHVIQPFFDKSIRPEVKYELAHAIANGETNDLLLMVDEICDKDSDLSSHTILIDGTLSSGDTGKTKGVSQKEYIKNSIKLTIQTLDTIINGAELNMDDDSYIDMAVRHSELLPILDSVGITNLIVSDKNKALVKYAEAKQAYDNAKDETDEEKTEKAKLKKKAEEALKEVKGLQDGEKAEFYTLAGLILANPHVRQLLYQTDVVSFTKAVYGKKFSELTQEERARISNEYKEYTEGKDTDLMLKALVNVYNGLSEIYGESFVEYGNSIDYKHNHAAAVNHILTRALVSDIDELKNIRSRELLNNLFDYQKDLGILGFSLTDTFNPKNLSDSVFEKRISNFDDVLNNLVKLLNTNEDPIVFKENLQKKLINSIKIHTSKIPISNLDAEIITSLFLGAVNSEAASFLNQHKTDQGFDYDVINNELITRGLVPLPADTDVDNNAQSLYNQFRLTPNKSSDLFDIHLEAGLQYVLNEGNLDNLLVVAIISRMDRLLRNLAVTTIADDTARSIVIQLVHEGLQNFKPSSVIIDSIENNQKLSELYEEDPSKDFSIDGISEIEGLVNKFLITVENSGIFKEYDKIQIKKDQFKKNPLLELLKKITYDVTQDGTAVNLLEAILAEENFINERPSLDDYTAPMLGSETIANLQKALTTAQALVAGMLKGAMYEGANIGINELMNYFYKKHKNENTSLATIDAKTAVLINIDIQNLKDKLEYIQTLTNNTAESQFKNDDEIRSNYSELLLSRYKEMFKELGDEDITSILNDRDPEEHPEDTVSKLEHVLYLKFKLLQEAEGTGKAVDTFFSGLSLKENEKLSTFGISKDTQKISTKDMIIRLAAAVMQDSGEFALIYKNIIEQNKDRVPFYILENAIRLGSAFACDRLKKSLNPDYDSVLDILTAKYNDEKGFITDFSILFINGVAGSGKTSVIMSSILKTLLLKAPSSLKMIIATAPSNRQIDALRKSLATGLLEEDVERLGLNSTTISNVDAILKEFVSEDDFNALNEQLHNISTTSTEDGLIVSYNAERQLTLLNISALKDGIDFRGNKSELPNVLFVDEVTHVPSAKLQLLSAVCKEYGIVLITSGDLSQDGAVLPINVNGSPQLVTLHIDIINCFQVPKISASVRNANIHKRNNNNLVELALSKYHEACATADEMAGVTKLNEYLSKNKIALDYYESDSELHGDKLVKSLTVTDLQRLKKAIDDKKARDPNAKIGIVTELTIDGNIADPAFRALITNTLAPSDYELYSVKGEHDKAVLGAEEEYVIIYNPVFDKTRNTADNLKKFYTLMTRAHQGTIIVSALTDPLFQYISQNPPKTTTGAYSLPINNAFKQIIKNRLDRLTLLVGQLDVSEIEYIEGSRKFKSTPTISLSNDEEDLDTESSGSQTEEEEGNEIVLPPSSSEGTPEVPSAEYEGPKAKSPLVQLKMLEYWKKYLKLTPEELMFRKLRLQKSFKSDRSKLIRLLRVVTVPNLDVDDLEDYIRTYLMFHDIPEAANLVFTREKVKTEVNNPKEQEEVKETELSQELSKVSSSQPSPKESEKKASKETNKKEKNQQKLVSENKPNPAEILQRLEKLINERSEVETELEKNNSSQRVHTYPFYTNLSNDFKGLLHYSEPLNLADCTSNRENSHSVIKGFVIFKNLLSLVKSNDKIKTIDDYTNFIKRELKNLVNHNTDIIAFLEYVSGIETNPFNIGTLIDTLKIDPKCYIFAEEYKDSANAPFAKVNDDEGKHLQDGRLLLTGGIKFSFKDKSRYISLFKFISDTNYNVEYYGDAYKNFHKKFEDQLKNKKSDKKLVIEQTDISLLDLSVVRDLGIVTYENRDSNLTLLELQHMGNIPYKILQSGNNGPAFKNVMIKWYPELENVDWGDDKTIKRKKFIEIGLFSGKKYAIIMNPRNRNLLDLIEHVQSAYGKKDGNILKFSKSTQKNGVVKRNLYGYLVSDYSLRKAVFALFLDIAAKIKSENLTLDELIANYKRENSKKNQTYKFSVIIDTLEKHRDKINGLIAGTVKFENISWGQGEARTFWNNYITYKKGGVLYQGPDGLFEVPKTSSLWDVNFYVEIPPSKDYGGYVCTTDTTNDSELLNFLHNEVSFYGAVEPAWLSFPIGPVASNKNTTSLSTLSEKEEISADVTPTPLNNSSEVVVEFDDTIDDDEKARILGIIEGFKGKLKGTITITLTEDGYSVKSSDNTDLVICINIRKRINC